MAFQDKWENLKDQASDQIEEKMKKAEESAKKAKDKYKENVSEETRSDIESTVQRTTETVRSGVNQASEKKKELTGEKLIQEVLKQMEKQQEYNDLLATKLEDALNRIDRLEEKSAVSTTSIEEFADRYENDRSEYSDDIIHRWKADDLLQGSIGSGVILADLIHEDGLNDQVSEELRNAFWNLTDGEVDSYQEARERIAEALQEGGEGVSQQWISTIKGRVGENQFLETASEQVEGQVRLAEISNQQGYDIVYQPPEDSTRYIDVKTSGDPDYIVEEMAETQAQLAGAEITTPGGEVVEDVEFAVPSNVFDEVQRQAAERDIDLNLVPIDTPSWHATEVVEAGVDAVGPEAMEHLFEEIFVGTLAASTLHSLREGFLVYKGAKNTRQAMESAAEETTLSGSSLGAGFIVESALREAALVGEPTTMAITFGSSIAVRTVLGDFVKRADHAKMVSQQNLRLQDNLEKVRSL